MRAYAFVLVAGINIGALGDECLHLLQVAHMAAYRALYVEARKSLRPHSRIATYFWASDKSAAVAADAPQLRGRESSLAAKSMKRQQGGKSWEHRY
jgi:hypothetical protein